MKTIFRTFSITLFTFISIQLLATTPMVDKVKNYTKSYPLNGSDEVSISNQFGKIVFDLWNKNEIKVEVTITASASSDEKAQKILDAIQIKDQKTGGKVSFNTEIGKNAGNNNQGKDDVKKKGFEINYIVYMPDNRELEINCQFGEIKIPDYQGKLQIDNKFGELNAGALTNVEEINLEFGAINADLIHGGDCSFKFSSFDVERISGSVELQIEFCKGSSLEINSALEDLEIKVNNSNFGIVVPRNFSGSYEIHTSFGAFKNNTNFDIPNQVKKNKYGPNFDGRYEGTSGSGKVPIEIHSSFSEITFRH